MNTSQLISSLCIFILEHQLVCLPSDAFWEIHSSALILDLWQDTAVSHWDSDKHWCPGDGVSPWHNHTLHYKHKSSTHHHYPQTESLIEEAKWPFLLTWGHLWKQLRKIIFKNVLKLQVLSWTGNRKNNLSKHWRDVKSLKSYSYMTNGTNCTS